MLLAIQQILKKKEERLQIEFHHQEKSKINCQQITINY
jgi:hypothetical protein